MSSPSRPPLPYDFLPPVPSFGLRSDDEGETWKGILRNTKCGAPAIDPDDPKGKIVDQRQKATVDAKGQQRVTGFAKGGNFTKIAPTEIGGAFRQAAQDAPEALDRHVLAPMQLSSLR